MKQRSQVLLEDPDTVSGLLLKLDAVALLETLQLVDVCNTAGTTLLLSKVFDM
jgi:hypothetical protein